MSGCWGHSDVWRVDLSFGWTLEWECDAMEFYCGRLTVPTSSIDCSILSALGQSGLEGALKTGSQSSLHRAKHPEEREACSRLCGWLWEAVP